MGKRLLKIALVLAASFAGLVALAAVAVYAAGPWVVERFLSRDIPAGEGRVRLHNPQFGWNLDLTADSLRYDSPVLDARVSDINASVNLFRSLFRFSPSLDLDVAEAFLRLKRAEDTVEKEKRPPRFKPFDLPASLKVRVGSLSAAGDSGDLGSLREVTLSDRGKRAARLSVAEASIPALGGMRPSLAADLDWSGREEIAGTVEIRAVPAGGGPEDSLRLDADARMDDLRRGRLELRMRIASVARHAALLGSSPYAAGAGGWDGTLKADFDLVSGIKASLALEGRFGGLSGPPDQVVVALGPQDLAVGVDFRDTAGSWNVSSRGGKDGKGGKRAEDVKGEDIRLEGRLSVLGRDSLENPAWIFRHMAVTLAGRVAGIPVRTAGRTLTADLDVERARLAPGRLQLKAATGDGSRAEADLTEGRKGWNGTFALEVAPDEAWARAFLDTSIAFRSLKARGSLRDGEVRAVTEALGVSAYGAEADSLGAAHRFGKKGYVLESARLLRKGTAWDLKGKVELSKRDKPLSFRMDGGAAGSAEFRMPAPAVMEVSARGLIVDRVPYRGLDSFSVYSPVVTADFRWDRVAREGRAEVDAKGRYRKDAVRAKAEAFWDRQRLEVKFAEAEIRGSRARAGGAVKLDGRQFFELKGLGISDLEAVSLEAERFDLAEAMRAAMPNPPLLSGILQGRFEYRPGTGFRGDYRVDSLQPAATRELLAVRELRIHGGGDTLRILAVTVSQKEPLLNDSVSLFLSGVLDTVQIVGFEARAGKTLKAGFRGVMGGFRDIRGTLAVDGSIQLPAKSGLVTGLRLRAEVAAPFKGALAGLKVRADTLRGEYVVAGVDTQAFSAPFQVADSLLVIPDLALRGRSGSITGGRVEYALVGGRISARVAGSGLAVQAGAEKILLRGFRAEIRADGASLAADASVGSGSLEYSDGPLRVLADFSRLEASYRSPMGKAAPADQRMPGALPSAKVVPARLRLRAQVDTSNVRYRLRSFANWKSVFRKSKQKRKERAGRPLEVDLSVETAGRGNAVETDVMRFSYVGNLALKGELPYALVQGRMTGTGGELGTKRAPYALRRLEVKWLNAPIGEGELDAEAFKKLASSCDNNELDSCTVVTRLMGELSNPKFGYDSDCQGSFGSGADVAAILYSVRRGCYAGEFAGDGLGMSAEEQALAMLEPLASQYLTRYAGKLTSNWIQKADVTGLGALAGDEDAGEDGRTGEEADVVQEAIAVEVLSKEFWRMRMRLSAGYVPQHQEQVDPWAYKVGVEWRPPLFRLVDDSVWKQRIKNNVLLEAAVFRDPTRATEVGENTVQSRLGLNYTYDWWGYWVRRGGRAPADTAGGRQAPKGTSR